MKKAAVRKPHSMLQRYVVKAPLVLRDCEKIAPLLSVRTRREGGIGGRKGDGRKEGVDWRAAGVQGEEGEQRKRTSAAKQKKACSYNEGL